MYHPPHSYLDFIRPAVVLWVLAGFARGLPRPWVALVGSFMAVFFLVPVARYLLPIIPFICIFAVKGFRQIEDRQTPLNVAGLYLVVFLFSLPIPWRVTADLVRPWRGILGYREYSIGDTQYVKSELEKVQPILIGPIWTNDPDLYLAMNWPVPVNDFYDVAEVPGSVIDWSKEPFSKINTRVELLPTATAMGEEPDTIRDWATLVVPLKRGKFTKLRIRQRMQ